MESDLAFVGWEAGERQASRRILSPEAGAVYEDLVTRLVLLVAAVSGGLAVLFFRAALFEGNLHPVIPGEIYRSGQPDPDRLGEWIDQLGLRSVLSFRRYGSDVEELMAERETCRSAGVEFRNLRLSGDRMPTPAALLQLVELLDTLERPLLLHCSGGVERSGLGASVALLLDGAAPGAARDQFDARYGYLAWHAGSELPLVVEQYIDWLEARALEHEPDRFREWVEKDYVAGMHRAEFEVLTLPEDPARVGADPAPEQTRRDPGELLSRLEMAVPLARISHQLAVGGARARLDRLYAPVQHGAFDLLGLPGPVQPVPAHPPGAAPRARRPIEGRFGWSRRSLRCVPR